MQDSCTMLFKLLDELYAITPNRSEIMNQVDKIWCCLFTKLFKKFSESRKLRRRYGTKHELHRIFKLRPHKELRSNKAKCKIPFNDRDVKLFILLTTKSYWRKDFPIALYYSESDINRQKNNVAITAKNSLLLQIFRTILRNFQTFQTVAKDH